MCLFPTEQWLVEYRRVLNNSTALDTVGVDWGAGADANVLIVIEDVPLSTTTIGDIPAEIVEDVPESVLSDLTDVTLAEAPSLLDESVRPSLPDVTVDLLEQIENCMVDDTVYAYIELDDGTCTAVETLLDPDDREFGTTLRASCRTWQQIVSGRPATSALLSGDLRVTGNSLFDLQSPTLLQLLGDLATDVETTHIFGEPSSSFSDFVLDTTVRQPVALQQLAYRQVALTSRLLSPF